MDPYFGGPAPTWLPPLVLEVSMHLCKNGSFSYTFKRVLLQIPEIDNKGALLFPFSGSS